MYDNITIVTIYCVYHQMGLTTYNYCVQNVFTKFNSHNQSKYILFTQLCLSVLHTSTPYCQVNCDSLRTHALYFNTISCIIHMPTESVLMDLAKIMHKVVGKIG